MVLLFVDIGIRDYMIIGRANICSRSVWCCAWVLEFRKSKEAGRPVLGTFSEMLGCLETEEPELVEP
jgi:hypothetical protein